MVKSKILRNQGLLNTRVLFNPRTVDYTRVVESKGSLNPRMLNPYFTAGKLASCDTFAIGRKYAVKYK